MNNGIQVLKNIMNNFSKDTISKAEKYINFSDVVKCANNIKDAVKNFENLELDEKKVAAILLSKKLFEESKNMCNI